MTHQDSRHQQGFTLVELMIALAFTAFILVFAMTAVIQVMQTYNKGLAVKQINQAGRSTLEEMARQLRGAKPDAVSVGAISANRVCFGAVSYVWNLWNTSGSDVITYEGDSSPLTFSRVEDSDGNMCKQDAFGNYPLPEKDKSTDILQSNVWVIAIGVSQPSVSEPLTDLTINLAVANDPTISGGQCSTGGTEGQFCATSNFSTTVITGGGN